MEYKNFDSLQALVLVLDPPGRVLHANRALTELTGLTLEQLRGQLASELLALPEDAQAARTRLALLAAGEPLSPRESQLPTAGGEERWVAWSWEPVRGPDGALQSVICVGVDRTETRRAAILRDLTERKQEALLAREAVLGIVAHDLRNPLFSIRLAAGLLSSVAGRPAVDLQRQVEVILRAEGQMSRLIEDLLEAFTIEAGAFTLDPRRQELEPLVREALSLQEPQARARDVRLRNELPEMLPAILCDRGRLLQVLANLLGNAVKFARDGGSAVVQARRLGSELCIDVADDGPGIPEEEHARLFDRFWKGRTRGPHGAGLGLYIARGIVEAHRGRIWVTSQPGAGSTFSFTLPLAPDEPAAA